LQGTRAYFQHRAGFLQTGAGLAGGPIIITVPSFTRACETALPVFRKGSLFD
jgi:hypothetical protein